MQEDPDGIPNQQISTVRKWGAFFSTLFSYCGFLGILAAYSMIKKPLGEQIGAEEAFLGIFNLIKVSLIV